LRTASRFYRLGCNLIAPLAASSEPHYNYGAALTTMQAMCLHIALRLNRSGCNPIAPIAASPEPPLI